MLLFGRGFFSFFSVSWHHSTLLQTHWASVSLKSYPVWFVFVYVLTACVFVTRDTVRHLRRFVFGKFFRKPNCSWSEAFVNWDLTIHIHIHVYVYIYIYIHVCIYTHEYVCIYIYTHVALLDTSNLSSKYSYVLTERYFVNYVTFIFLNAENCHLKICLVSAVIPCLQRDDRGHSQRFV